jgi:hypothetical protein
MEFSDVMCRKLEKDAVPLVIDLVAEENIARDYILRFG